MPLQNTPPQGGVIYPGAAKQEEGYISPVSIDMGKYMQELYNWVNDTAFYTSAPSYLRPFYRKVQNWERWVNGIVPTFHNFNQGLVPTHLARFIVDKVSDLVFGDGITLSLRGENVDKTIPNASLKKIGEFARRTSLNEKARTVTGFAVSLGTAALKLNLGADGELWCEAVPMNRMRYSYDSNGKPTEATFQVDMFVRNDKRDATNYGLFERRFIHNGKPYAMYSFYQISAQANQYVEPVHLGHLDVPHDVWEQFKAMYGDLRLDTPILMPFDGIGLYPYRFTDVCKSMPHLHYGDSVLEGLNKYLCDYDILNAVIDTEMYCARARVFANKAARNPAMANQNSGLDSFLLTYYDGMTNQQEPLKFVQPAIRSGELIAMRNAILENIAAAIGINPSSFAPFLNDGGRMTARQVSVEESETTLFVSNKRKGLLTAINAMLDDVRKFYGLLDGVHAEFSIAGQTNYSLTVENTARKYQAGLMSLDAAVRAVNPGMDEAQIAREIEQIKKERAEAQEAQKANLWDFGDTEQING